MEFLNSWLGILSRRTVKIVFIVTFLVFAIVLKDTVQRSQTLKNIAKDSKYVQSAHSASVKASQVFFKIAHYYDPTFNHRASLRICRRPNLSGKSLLTINATVPSLEELDRQFQHITLGGHWEPSDCRQRQKVAVIIPFRNRWHHLPILIRHLHNLLVRQNRHYTIYVVDQQDQAPFNRGQLINVGVIEALKREPNLNCFVLHDVDTLPENLFAIYKCNEDPRLVTQMATYQKKRKYKAAYRRYTGGVLSIWRHQYEEINGFSNEFWGWGGEDDDLANRITKKGYDVQRDFSRTAYFYSLEHPYTDANPEREAIVKRHLTGLYLEGLNSTRSALLNVTTHRTFTLFAVDLSESYKYYQGLQL